MNTIVTSKEKILEKSRELIREQGWAAVNIRSVAAVCGVSVGSIYNYFDSKAELVGAAVESVWHEIFHQTEEDTAFQDIMSCIIWIFGRMEYGSREYPGFFTLHSMAFMQEDKANGEERMRRTWRHILDRLSSVLDRDLRIRPDAFNEQFTREKFASALFSLILSALLRQDYNPDTVLEIIRRTLY